jgi:hypothetical protein
MSRQAFLASGLLATALSGIIALELRDPTPDTADPPAPRLRAAVAAADPTPARAPVALSKLVDKILARPLFSPDRRPPPPAPGGPAATATVSGLPRLAGVLVGPFGRSAIFAPASGGKPVTAAEGARLGAYTVQSIEIGQVTVQGPNGVQVLHPSFDPNAPRPETPPAVPPPAAPARGPGGGQRTSQPWQLQPPVASR